MKTVSCISLLEMKCDPGMPRDVTDVQMKDIMLFGDRVVLMDLHVRSSVDNSAKTTTSQCFDSTFQLNTNALKQQQTAALQCSIFMT